MGNRTNEWIMNHCLPHAVAFWCSFFFLQNSEMGRFRLLSLTLFSDHLWSLLRWPTGSFAHFSCCCHLLGNLQGVPLPLQIITESNVTSLTWRRWLAVFSTERSIAPSPSSAFFASHSGNDVKEIDTRYENAAVCVILSLSVSALGQHGARPEVGGVFCYFKTEIEMGWS